MMGIKRTFIVALVIISGAKNSEAAETCDQLFSAVSPIQSTFTQLKGEGLSLALFQTHTPSEVVESIIANRRARMKAANKLISKADFISVDLMDPANELMLFFSSHDRNQLDNTAGIESIRKNGFLTLFETGTSNSTNLNTSWRERVEQWTAGSSLSVLPAADATLTSVERASWLSLHPKSMIVNLATVPMFDRETGDPNRYGDVIAVFKNELKKRAIWTSDDSPSVAVIPLARLLAIFSY